MLYSHDISRSLEEAIGKDGVSAGRLKEITDNAVKAVAVLEKRRKDGSLPVLSLPEREDDLGPIEEAAKRAQSFKTFVVIGLGGSSYGGKTLERLVHNPFCHGARTSVHFIDNIDPLTSDKLILSLDVKTTLFALISKSGDTAETMAHALILTHEVKDKLGADAVKNHFIVITEPKDSALTRLAKAHGIQALPHDTGIGGRFSVLTNVGLLPAKVAGLDIKAVRQGAAQVVKQTFETPESSEPVRGAALQMALIEKGRNISVLMPYCDRLETFTTWYRQLWAESLGKGGHGTTPIRAMGACDQHSQLQLYLDGPRDKLISFLLLEQTCKGAMMPNITDPTLSYLKGRTLGDLMDAEQRATAETLTRNRQPARIFALKELSEETMGALLMHFMLETMIMGELLGVNTFDQPAVEQGKVLAREYLAAKK